MDFIVFHPILTKNTNEISSNLQTEEVAKPCPIPNRQDMNVHIVQAIKNKTYSLFNVDSVVQDASDLEYKNQIQEITLKESYDRKTY